MDEPSYDVRRSPRRRRTMTVYRENGRLVAVVPAHLTARQEATLLPPLVARFLQREAGRTVPAEADELSGRAHDLFDRFLAAQVGQALPPVTVAWVANQHKRWGSCSPASGRIRLSDRLRGMPLWVGDYVLLHELVHLFEPTHSPRFHRLLSAYPQHERAQGFLEGFQAATGVTAADSD